MAKRIRIIRNRNFDRREREALKECIRALEVKLHQREVELKKYRREVYAARLLLSITRALSDRRVTITQSRRDEMIGIQLNLLENEQIQIPPYSEALRDWENL